MIKSFLVTGLVAVSVSGCATIDVVKGWVPSFWDDNQSAKIVDIRQSIAQLNCEKDHLPQVQRIHDNLQWFELYSESKGWRQKDVLRLTKPMQETVADFYKRSQTQQGSVTYCELKKKILTTQAATAAEAILGRY